MTTGATDQPTAWAAADLLFSTLYPYTARLAEYVSHHTPPDLRRLVDPQDVVQDTLFEAVRSVNGFAPDGEPEPEWRWLVTLARHRLINLIASSRAAKRGGGARALGEDELAHGSVVALLQDLAGHQHTPSRSATRRELVVVIEKSLERLRPEYRDAVRLRYVDGLSLREAAGKLGRSEDAARKLCVRGLRALRVELRTLSLYV